MRRTPLLLEQAELLVTHEAPSGYCHSCQTRGPRLWALHPVRGLGSMRHALCRGCLGVRSHRSLL